MTGVLADRTWVPTHVEDYVRSLAADTAARTVEQNQQRLHDLVEQNRQIHREQCVNLNPAANVMNPRAEALLGAELGSRPSLGYPGDKYETGLEAIEQIEVFAAELAAEVFGARFAEIRVGSGALANTYAFLATCRPGDTVIAPPATIGGHATHHANGAAGLLGLRTVQAPVAADGYTVDVAGLAELAREVRPALITIGGSLNLFPHPIAEIRAIADDVGAPVLFDAAHACGMIAGGAWPNPLREGAHLMTMSTYKSLGGPAGGVVVTDDADLAQRLDAIAYPGLTANYDASKAAALAQTMLDWQVAGAAYARTMVDNARALAAELAALGLPVFMTSAGATSSHQFAVRAADFGGGQAAGRRLRRANLLACGIGLPVPAVDGDVNGLRLGTPEVTRLGMAPGDMPVLAGFIARGLRDADPEAVGAEVTAWRAPFRDVHFTTDRPT